MPIPAFDVILNLLPPYLGTPCSSSTLAPYECTIEELCERFATTPKRKQILEGFLNFRAELLALGIQGFQWIDGSFMENVEVQQGRDPGDIDVVTFIRNPLLPNDLIVAFRQNPLLLSKRHVKATYLVDHFIVSLGSNPESIVEHTRFWYGLFSHRKADGAWKGMLTVNLMDKSIDDTARIILRSKA